MISKEFNNYLNEKRKQAAREQLKKRGEASKAKVIDSDKMKEMIKKAMKSAAKYNKMMQREKQEDRLTFFDLQTMVTTFFRENKLDSYRRLIFMKREFKFQEIGLFSLKVSRQNQDHIQWLSYLANINIITKS